MPTAVHRLERLTARCLALHDVRRSYVARAFRRLGIFCGGGIPASSLKDRAHPLRDEHVRRVYGNGANCHALTRCHDPAPRVSARSSIPAEPLAVTDLTAMNQERIIAAFLNVHATRRRLLRGAGIHSGKAATPEPAIRSTVPRPVPDRFRARLARASFMSRAPTLRCAEVCGSGMAPTDRERTPSMTRRNRIWEKAFPSALQTTGIIVHAAKAAKVGRRTVYEHLNGDPDFADRCREALDTAEDNLETELRRRAAPSKASRCRCISRAKWLRTTPGKATRCWCSPSRICGSVVNATYRKPPPFAVCLAFRRQNPCRPQTPRRLHQLRKL